MIETRSQKKQAENPPAAAPGALCPCPPQESSGCLGLEPGHSTELWELANLAWHRPLRAGKSGLAGKPGLAKPGLANLAWQILPGQTGPGKPGLAKTGLAQTSPSSQTWPGRPGPCCTKGSQTGAGPTQNNCRRIPKTLSSPEQDVGGNAPLLQLGTLVAVGAAWLSLSPQEHPLERSPPSGFSRNAPPKVAARFLSQREKLFSPGRGFAAEGKQEA